MADCNASLSSAQTRIFLTISTALSFLGSCYIVILYSLFKGVRRHPNQILVKKALADMVWCICVAYPILYEFTIASGPRSWDCDGFCSRDPIGNVLILSFCTQVADVFSNLQFATIAIDLYLNSKSPFTDFGKNLYVLDAVTLTISLIFGACLIFFNGYGESFVGFCQAKLEVGVSDSFFYLLSMGPIFLSVILQIMAMSYAKKRYKQRAGYHNRIWRKRNESLYLSYKYTITFCIYWVMMVIFETVILALVDSGVRARATHIVAQIYAFLTGLRALPTVWIWVAQYPPARLRNYEKNLETHLEEMAPQLNAALREEMVEYIKHGILWTGRKNLSLDDTNDIITVYLTPSVLDRFRMDFSVKQRDLTPLKPKHSMLRRQVSITSLKGLIPIDSPSAEKAKFVENQGIELRNLCTTHGSEIDRRNTTNTNSPTFSKQNQRSSRLDPKNLGVVISAARRLTHPEKARRISHTFKLGTSENDNDDCNVVFSECMASTFRDLRTAMGISKQYDIAMKRVDAGKETGGRSGSFFFFTKCGQFALKTMNKSEFNVLCSLVQPVNENTLGHQIAQPYVEYIKENPDSLIVKILGVYMLHMKDYTHTVYLYVMNSIFPPGIVLDEKYDIKGMGGEGAPCCPGPIIDRRSQPPRNGSIERCKHCHKMYIVGSDEEAIGGIWPNEVSVESLVPGTIIEYRSTSRRGSRRKNSGSETQSTKNCTNNFVGMASLPENVLASSTQTDCIEDEVSHWRQGQVVTLVDGMLALDDVKTHKIYGLPLVSVVNRFVHIHKVNVDGDITAIRFFSLDNANDRLQKRNSDELSESSEDDDSINTEDWTVAFAISIDPKASRDRTASASAIKRRKSAVAKAKMALLPLILMEQIKGNSDDVKKARSDVKKLFETALKEVTFIVPGTGDEFRLSWDSFSEIESSLDSSNVSRVSYVTRDTPVSKSNPSLLDFPTFSMDFQFSNTRFSACPVLRKHKPVRDLLDGDLLNRVVLMPRIQIDLVRRITRDTAFLCQHGIMDYSLLLGVENHQFENVHFDQQRLTFDTNTSLSYSNIHSKYMHSKTYHVGIIDLLRVYGRAKAIENFNKRYILCRGDRISAVKPAQYKYYFDDFIKNEVFPNRRIDTNFSRDNNIEVKDQEIKNPLSAM